MNSGRVTFQRRKDEVIGGRQQETWRDHYTTWADFPALSVKEQAEANNREMVDAITMEVRTCRKVEEMQRNMKDFRAAFKGRIYELKAADPSRQHAGFVRLLVSRAE